MNLLKQILRDVGYILQIIVCWFVLWLVMWAAFNFPFMSDAHSQTLPTGYLGAIQSGNTPGSYSTYTYSYTPTTSGSQYVLFAFRHDPAYWSFGNVSLVESGIAGNLLLNGNMATGGSVTANGRTVAAPTHWGVFYQNGVYPSSAGRWQGTGGPLGQGQWYDGAVGSFDGIYQGVNLTAGTTYSLSFMLKSTSGVANTSSVQVGVYAGTCANAFISAASCSLPTTSGWTNLATPSQTGTAGGVTVVNSTTTTRTVSYTIVGTSSSSSTTSDRQVFAVVNGQSVIQTFRDTTTTTVTPTTVSTYQTPVTTTTYSDGSVVESSGTPVLLSSSTTTSSTVNTVQGTVPINTVPAYVSEITAQQQARVDALANRRDAITNSKAYIIQDGSRNSITVEQIGNGQLLTGIGSDAAVVEGDWNSITIRQGDVASLGAGKNIIELEVRGSFNTLNLNQGRDSVGGYTSADGGGHMQTVKVIGDSNTVTTVQQNGGSGGHYLEVDMNGNNNINSITQQGDTGKTAFTKTAGSNNTLTVSQSGNANHYTETNLIGNGNTVEVTQYGNTQNRSTITAINLGAPAAVSLTQSGGGVYNIERSCVTSCGVVTVSQ